MHCDFPERLQIFSILFLILSNITGDKLIISTDAGTVILEGNVLPWLIVMQNKWVQNVQLASRNVQQGNTNKKIVKNTQFEQSIVLGNLYPLIIIVYTYINCNIFTYTE